MLSVLVASISVAVVLADGTNADLRRHCNGESRTCAQQHQARTLLQHAAGVAERALQSVVTDADAAGDKTQQEPGSLKHYINEQLLPSEEKTKMELQGEVDRALNDFDGCTLQLNQVQDSFQQQEQTLVTAEQRHNECEMKAQMTNRSEEEHCGALDEYAKGLTSPMDFSTVNSSDTESFIRDLKIMKDYFGQVFPTLKEMKQKCEVAKSDELVTQEQCDADKKSIEASWCSLKTERRQACDTFDTCFSGKEKRFDEVVKYVKEGEAISKLNFKTLACHGDDDCTSMESDTSHLSVSYPAKPGKIECDLEVKTGWDYASVRCEGDVMVESNTEVTSNQTTS